jgi:hypothetical protein
VCVRVCVCVCGRLCGNVCELLCANCDTLCDCFLCRVPKVPEFSQPPPPPDAPVECSLLPLLLVEDFADPHEGSEDSFGGADDESDDFPEVVEPPEVEPQQEQ